MQHLRLIYFENWEKILRRQLILLTSLSLCGVANSEGNADEIRSFGFLGGPIFLSGNVLAQIEIITITNLEIFVYFKLNTA